MGFGARILEWWDDWGQEREPDRELAEVDPRYEPFEYLINCEEVKGFRDREGKRISADNWLDLHGDLDYRTLAISALDTREVGNGDQGVTLILTMWLGVVLRGHTKFLFETGVLRGPLDGTVRKYKYEMDARVGHEQVLRDVLDRSPGAQLLDEFRTYQ